MALKHNISKLEEVEEAFRSHYKAVDAADPEKGFVLDVEGAPQPEDTTALKNALERVRAEKEAATKLAKKNGEDLEAVRASFEPQLETLRKQIKASEEKAKEATFEKTLGDFATSVFGENADVLTPYVKQRLAMDENNIVRVLGKDGKASALSLEDLKTEFKNDKKFAPFVQAGRSSGSGASDDSNTNGGAGGGGRVGNFTKMPENATASELTNWLAQNKTPGFTL